jgi:hypothetical protein
MSAIKDKRYLEHRLAILGKTEAVEESKKAQPLSDEELKRFTTSLGSAESLFSKRAGEIPKNVVADEEKDIIEGSSYPSPVRYGDWEYNGRCTDF